MSMDDDDDESLCECYEYISFANLIMFRTLTSRGNMFMDKKQLLHTHTELFYSENEVMFLILMLTFLCKNDVQILQFCDNLKSSANLGNRYEWSK
jgi:hypothetical protein